MPRTIGPWPLLAAMLAVGAGSLTLHAAPAPTPAGPVPDAQVPAAQPPNVLLILSDDQAWGDYGFMGHPHIRTPALDRLASQSLVFTRGYVPTSLCRPSLASILTGLYPHQHGITGNDPSPKTPERRAALDLTLTRIPTLPRSLAEQGYISLQTGKWWEGTPSNGGFTQGMTQGFPANKKGRHGDEGLAIGRETLKPALDFLDQRAADGKPFLLWYAPMLPHRPHNPPERLLALSRPLAPSENVAKYWAMCQWFDETIGQILERLDQRGLAPRTLVVYVADNGWVEPIDPRLDLGGGVGGPRGKRSPYDAGLRSPILLRWPQRIAPRRDERSLASTIDILPTVLHASGAKLPKGLPGIDLLNAEALAQRKAIFGSTFTHDIPDLANPAAGLLTRWIIRDDLKLIVHRAEPPQAPASAPELYDLRADPHEATNLAAGRPADLKSLETELNAWWTPDSQTKPTPTPTP